MQQAVSFYGWLLFNRTLFDEAPLLAPILAQLIERGELEAPAFYLSLYRGLIFPDKASVDNDVCSKLQQLTAKEREVLMLLSQGLSNQEIAQQLEVTAATTKWHLKNIYRKLSLESRAAAVAMVHTLQPQLG
ncbi:helix-turn-helix domain-containing protein [Bacterioplanoides pacificum]|uniref:Helix-turn-helix transcriptional regulator n=1 Tax=Bacterioplanoides pacificum TaxID=1171596 RepID=A0ABV7VVT0_9GAMM